MRNLGAGQTRTGDNPPPGGRPATPSTRTPRPLRPPTSRQTVAAPPRRPVGGTPKKIEQPAVQKPIMVFDQEMLRKASEGPVRPEDLLNQKANQPAPAKEVPGGGTAVVEPDEEEGPDGKKGSKRPVGKGVVPGRDTRRVERDKRAKDRKHITPEVVVERGKVVTLDEEDRRRRPGDRLRDKIKKKQQATMPRIGKVPIDMPITVRSLGQALGIKSIDLLFKLMSHGQQGLNINSTIEPDMAELIAVDCHC